MNSREYLELLDSESDEDFLELLKKADSKRKHRRTPRDIEHRIQVACVRWFRLQYHNFRGLLFAVPNGGYRNETTAAKMKAEGVWAGVSDIILLYPNKSYHGLCIEMKTPSGKQSEHQIEWQKDVENQGYKYTICHSFDEFKDTVENYLNDEK